MEIVEETKNLVHISKGHSLPDKYIQLITIITSKSPYIYMFYAIFQLVTLFTDLFLTTLFLFLMQILLILICIRLGYYGRNFDKNEQHAYIYKKGVMILIMLELLRLILLILVQSVWLEIIHLFIFLINCLIMLSVFFYFKIKYKGWQIEIKTQSDQVYQPPIRQTLNLINQPFLSNQYKNIDTIPINQSIFSNEKLGKLNYSFEQQEKEEVMVEDMKQMQDNKLSQNLNQIQALNQTCDEGEDQKNMSSSENIQ